MKDFWKYAVLIQNALMFGMYLVCLCSGWTEMTRIVFCVYLVVAGGFLAAGIIISSLDGARDDNKVVTLRPEGVPKLGNDKKRKAA